MYLSLLSATDGETLVGGIFQRFDNAPNISSSCGMNQVMWNNPDNVTADVQLGISCVSTACAGKIAFMAGPTPIVDIPPGNMSSGASCPSWMTWQSSAFDTPDCRLAPGYYVTSDGTGALCPAGTVCPGGMTLGEAVAATTGGFIPCPPGSANASSLSGATSLASCGVVGDPSLLNSSPGALAIVNPVGQLAVLSLIPSLAAAGQTSLNGSIALINETSGSWLPAYCGSAFLRSPAAAVGGVTFMQVGFSIPGSNVSSGSASSPPLTLASEAAWAINASFSVAYPSITLTAVTYVPTPGAAPPSTNAASGAVITMPAMVMPWAVPFGDVSVAVGVTPSLAGSAFHVATFTASQRLGGITSQHGPALSDCSMLSSSAAAVLPLYSMFLVCGTPSNQSLVAIKPGGVVDAAYASNLLWTLKLQSAQPGVVVVTGMDISPDGQQLSIFALTKLGGGNKAITLAVAQVAIATGTLIAPFSAIATPAPWLASSSMLNGATLVNLSFSSLTATSSGTWGAASPSYAVDGNAAKYIGAWAAGISPNCDTDTAIAVVQPENGVAWLLIDMGATYVVNTVFVYGRNSYYITPSSCGPISLNDNCQSMGLNISVSNTNTPGGNMACAGGGISAQVDGTAVVCNFSGRYVSILRATSNVMSICQVVIQVSSPASPLPSFQPSVASITSFVRVPSQLPSVCSSRPDGFSLSLQLGNGSTLPVVCHSGMVLLAKLDGGSPLWNYASWLWTTNSTLNPGSLTFDIVEAKLAAFNAIPVTRLRVGMLSLPSASSTLASVSWLNLTLSSTYPSLLSAILANATLASNASAAEWISLLGGAASVFGNSSFCVTQGINVVSAGTATPNVRIGLTATSTSAPSCSNLYTVGFGLGSSGGNATSAGGVPPSLGVAMRRFGYILGSDS